MKEIWTLILLLWVGGDAAKPWPDCNGTGESNHGPFGPLTFHNITWNDKIFYVLVPEGGTGPWPVLIFMHGWTGAWEQYGFLPTDKRNSSTWYAKPLDIYASHGFVVVFPHVVGPIADLNRSSLETNASSIYKSIDLIRTSQANKSSPLYGMIDEHNLAIAGHSMGSGDTILAGSNLSVGTAKFLAIQHPASYFMDTQHFDIAGKKVPLILTTSTNDAAFFPAPETAQRVVEQFNKSNVTVPAALLQFSSTACQNSTKSQPWGDEGHCCSFKPDVETPWILRGLKHYLQLKEDPGSRCASMLFGSGLDSPAYDPNMDLSIVLPGRRVVYV